MRTRMPGCSDLAFGDTVSPAFTPSLMAMACASPTRTKRRSTVDESGRPDHLRCRQPPRRRQRPGMREREDAVAIERIGTAVRRRDDDLARRTGRHRTLANMPTRSFLSGLSISRAYEEVARLRVDARIQELDASREFWPANVSVGADRLADGDLGESLLDAWKST